ncbi:xanthine dehydrogenase family protein subunit M [Phycicoccus sp. CSK15P-2]|uniref:FAD binding domain-containing protein n=1 Tax=Phycicoccus sp. CSK15P-2 TaxID=2807627 RepID=UPI00194E393C|nr:xanthine dehydrogenase family protein subunit M [Phycicoccus sp. CSK15P-2]MBM6404172.1 xanthine dehydrogenase family protein subunit M [Phycicoccus sp. CSK15P-2]
MRPFDYARPADVDEALSLVGDTPGARFLGGGTNLVDLLRRGVETADLLVDVSRLPLDEIEEAADGGLRVGAGVRNSDLAHHPLVRRRYPVLSRALLSGASGQLRAMATVGGNLHQRTRCPYFTDLDAPCNKRDRGAGCAARHGASRGLAVLGTSERCAATHPSDLAVALVALDARIELASRDGVREVSADGFHVLPGETPDIETVARRDELVTAVVLPSPPPGRGDYRKVRDRASYAFALVSVAAVLDVVDGDVASVRLGLGGVGTVPWRAHRAEAHLTGSPLSDERVAEAVALELADARTTPDNAFKVELARRTAVATLRRLATPSDSTAGAIA